MLWSLNSAASAGLENDRKEVMEWTPWAADRRHWNKTGDKDGVDTVSAGTIDTMVFLLLGRDANVEPAPALTTEFRQQILKNQQPDGSWLVPSTRARDKNKVNQTATYWGTTWAVIGLLEVKSASK